jgi:hypothetical protein
VLLLHDPLPYWRSVVAFKHTAGGGWLQSMSKHASWQAPLAQPCGQLVSVAVYAHIPALHVPSLA